MTEDPNRTDKLLAQYREAVATYHHLERTLWQLPSITILVISAVVGVAYQILLPGVPRVLLLFIAAFVSLGVTVAMARFSYCIGKQAGVINRLRDIEVALGLGFIYGDFRKLFEDKKPKVRFWLRWGTDKWLTLALLIVTGLLFALAIHEIFAPTG